MTAPSRYPCASAVVVVGLTWAVLLALPGDFGHVARTPRGGLQRLDADALHEHGAEHTGPNLDAGADGMRLSVLGDGFDDPQPAAIRAAAAAAIAAGIAVLPGLPPTPARGRQWTPHSGRAPPAF